MRFLSIFWLFGSPETQASHEKPAGKQCFLKVPSFSSSTLFWLRSFSKARLWWLRAQKSQNQVGQKKLGGPAGKPPRLKNGIWIGNFQAEVPKNAISSHFLAFCTPRNPGLTRKTCRKTVFFEGAFVFVIDALLAQVIFESTALVAPSAKIAEPGGAKKVGRSGREGP